VKLLTLAIAKTLIEGALDAASEFGFAPMAVVVLDSGGHIIAAERQDGASFHRIDVARGKAYGGLALGVGSRAIMARAKEQAFFVASVNGLLGGNLVPVPGGVLIANDDKEVIGAIGVSGDSSDNDEIAAIRGITATGLTSIAG